MSQEQPLIAFGCQGGRHRSAALACLHAEDLRALGHSVETWHRELTISKELA